MASSSSSSSSSNSSTTIGVAFDKTSMLDVLAVGVNHTSSCCYLRLLDAATTACQPDSRS